MRRCLGRAAPGRGMNDRRPGGLGGQAAAAAAVVRQPTGLVDHERSPRCGHAEMIQSVRCIRPRQASVSRRMPWCALAAHCSWRTSSTCGALIKRQPCTASGAPPRPQTCQLYDAVGHLHGHAICTQQAGASTSRREAGTTAAAAMRVQTCWSPAGGLPSRSRSPRTLTPSLHLLNERPPQPPHLPLA